MANLRNVYDFMRMMRDEFEEEEVDDVEYGYSDAVRAVMNSGCGDYYKQEIMKLIPIDASSELCKAVAAIVDSDTSDYYCYVIIRKMMTQKARGS